MVLYNIINILEDTKITTMKVVKLKDQTYEKLGDIGHYRDTMDSIIWRLLEERKGSSAVLEEQQNPTSTVVTGTQSNVNNKRSR